MVLFSYSNANQRNTFDWVRIRKHYIDSKFPIDRELDGNVFVLNSDDNILDKSKVLYHPSVLVEKQFSVEWQDFRALGAQVTRTASILCG